MATTSRPPTPTPEPPPGFTAKLPPGWPSGRPERGRRADRKPLPPPRWTGSTAFALVEALAGALIGCALLLESPAGLAPAVFDGPARLVGPLPGPWWVAWGVIFLLPSCAVLAMAGQPRSRYVVGLLAVAVSSFAISALHVGLTRADASCIGGILAATVAVLTWLTALALARRPAR